MTDWVTVSVSSLQEQHALFVEDGNHGGDRPRPNEFTTTGMAFIRAADMSGGTIDFTHASKITPVAEARIRKGFGRPLDVILSHKGTVGRVAIAPADSPAFVCSPQTTYWRSLDHDVIDPRYLRYFLESPEFTRQLDSRSRETDMAPYVSLTEQRKLLVTLPAIAEQRGIAATLGALDKKIESNNQLISLIPQLIRAHVARVLIVDGYEVPVVQLASFVNGGAYTRGASGTGHMVIRIAELNSGPGRSTVYSDIDVPDNKTARAGDILMSWSGSLDVYRWSRDEAIINQHIFKVIPADGFPAWLVFDRLKAVMPVFQGIAKDKATTMGHIQRGHLESTTVGVPPASVIESLDLGLGPLWKRLLLAERENLRIAQLRDVLLPELLAGRMHVPVPAAAVGVSA